MERDYEAEIIQALKEKPRDGLTLQKDLHFRVNKTLTILKEMEDKNIILWNEEKIVWEMS